MASGDAQDKYALTEDQQKWIARWLEACWKQGKCPICATDKWQIAPHLVAPIISSGGVLNVGGRTYPQVMIICSNCGFTNFFNAGIMGLLGGLHPPLPKKGG